METAGYPETLALFVAGQWRRGAGRACIAIENPADGSILGELPVARTEDIDDAIASSVQGFHEWSRHSPWQRAEILLRAESLIAADTERLARIITLENGKPLPESRGEIDRVRETLVYCAEEGKRTYGRIYPPRAAGLAQTVIKRPLGPVAGFSPWNFPAVLPMRKIAPALAAGCSIVLKPAEECPAICIELVRLMIEAGVPANALNLLFGDPATISDRLIAAPEIRKISFTGSIAVGKLLAEKAGRHLKAVTMELGGHAPVIVFDDVDAETVALRCAMFKYRNAGQVCLAPSRFYIHDSVFPAFTRVFAEVARQLKVGPGLEPGTEVGPLSNRRRLEAAEALVDDIVKGGGALLAGGQRFGNAGYFFAPTVATDINPAARILTEEPFCPIAPLIPFTDTDAMFAAANNNDVGLSAYAFTNSLDRAHAFTERIQAAWLGINDFVPLLADAPVAAHRQSGLGYEGGPEGLDAFLETKFVSQRLAP